MKKLLLMSSLIASTAAMAQLPNGSICPNFTGTDLDGVTHTLYDYLDQGYSVVVDVSATWCGPCWNYHNSGALEDLYTTYGPGTAENKVIVLMIEGDNATTLADLNGTGGNTQGDWVTGTPYPIINSGTIANLLQISYYPTIYTICPSRVIVESGQISMAQHWSIANACAVAVTGTNVGVVTYNGSTSVCGNLDMPVTIQNLGTSPITSATVTVKQGATTLATQNWTGNLSTYEMDDVIFSNVAVTNAEIVTVNITTNGDVEPSDNELDPGLTSAAPVSWEVTVEGKVDQYPNEFAWRLVDPNGVMVAYGGNYTLVNETTTNCDNGLPAAGPGTYGANAVFAVPVQLTEMGCYLVEAYDAYGDGLSGSATSYFRVRNSNSQIVVNSVYSCEASHNLSNDAVGVEETNSALGFELYPNPTNGTVNMVINTNEAVNVDVFNVLGARVMTRAMNNNGVQSIDMSSLNDGLYYFNVNVGGNSTTRKVTLAR
ncbi:MAG: T9SS type A sorting domain-containing protein [Flavobacteriales bacterium]